MSKQLNNRYYEKGDTIRVKTLGLTANDAVSNNWILNSATTYKVENLEKINVQNFRYKLTLDNSHIFRIGDTLTITGNNFKATSKVYSVNDSNQITIGDQGSIDNVSVDSLVIRKNVLKGRATNYDLSQLSANVQNVYKKGTDTLVASSSIPYYKDTDLAVKDTKITFSGTFPPTGSAATDTFKILSTGDHGLYTGDVIYYSPQKTTSTRTDIDGNTITTVRTQTGIAEEGIYFVKRLTDTTTIKLAKSRSQLFNETYITTQPITVTDNTIELYSSKDKTLENQKLFREIPGQNNNLNQTLTEPGTKNGILVNGVEIFNYKSLDGINYGKIESIVVDNPGNGYDVITPPNVVISDTTGVGATANAAVVGSFNRIDLLDTGFDYIKDPAVTITGGNGKGATAVVNTSLVEHNADFNSAEVDGLVTIGSTSAIGFSTYHKFRDHERVIYKSNNQSGIVGLTTGAFYYVSVQTNKNVKLHKNIDDAIAGVNTVTFTDYGSGRHTLQATDLKRIVSSVEVASPGTGYQNRKTTLVGISTALNEFSVTSHGYSSGEKVKYIADSDTVGGLSNGTEYYITKVDDDTFKLSAIGPTSDSELFYRTKQYVNITSPQTQVDGLPTSDVGIHHFNYPDIVVSVVGEIGISSIGSETFEARVSPIVRGRIDAINLQNKGVGYGSSEVINHVREPEVSLQVGSDVQLTPIVANGKVVQVIVNNGGKNINAIPELNVVSDSGQGCVLTPVVSGGRITSVTVIGGGFGYLIEDTTIEITFPGIGAKFRPTLQRWTINEYQRNITNITSDDVFITNSLNTNFGLQSVHLYAPRLLRQELYQNKQDGTVTYNSPDLVLDNGVEKLTSKNHSPIIGWAYDGNPIYGPFGYLRKNGGIVTQMRSGYKISLQSNRPPSSVFPEGFFVEDYQHIESSSDDVLDENNGRFCITPEFPKGTYAYFSTLSEVAESQGVFKGFKVPQFPYLIGNSLYSKPSNLSYLKSSNHDEYDVQKYGWRRNTSFYNLEKDDSSYPYVERPFKLTNTQLSKVTYAAPGSIGNIGILTGGTNYKVGDSLVIDNTDTQGFNADVRVSKIGGKQVSSISCATTSISSIEVNPTGKTGEYSFVVGSPHDLLNQELISIAGLSTTAVKLSGQYRVGVTTSTLVLRAGVGTTGATGITTYFDIYGFGLDNIVENDVFKIGDEKVKILNVDRVSSRVRVLREVLGTSGAAHTATTIFYEEPRRFTSRVGFNTTFDFRLNKEYYFEPQNTLALGMSAGVGIGTTITFVNPGSGVTNVFVPSQTLYLPSHGLKTGDELIYKLNSQDEAIGVSTAGVSTFALADQQKLFVAKITEDQIGVSTVRVGLNSTGTFAGIGSTNAHQGLLFFTGYGQGSNHSFITNYPNVISVSAFKNTVTVSTASTHGLTVLDTVYVDVRPSTTKSFAVSYDDYNQRIIIDKKDVVASDINVSSNEITISDHEFKLGQSLIYTASSPAGGLVANKIYYAVIVDKNTIKLSESYFDSISSVPTIVDITSATNSSFSPINPEIKAYKESTIEFDLSDSSLTYVRNSVSYPAFRFALFTDNNFDTEFNKTSDNEDFEVLSTGTVGTDGKVTITLNNTIPKTLYYKLVPVSNDFLPIQKSTVVCDPEVIGYNQLSVLDSVYSGKQSISIASSTSFRYLLERVPEKTSYTSSDAIINYSTDSASGIGSIVELKTFNRGSNYHKLPSVRGVTSASGIGSNAAFEVTSTDIGVIKKTKLRSIGFDYPYDTTLKPTAKLPEIVKITNLAILDQVGVSSFGYGYGSIAPKVLLFDGQTGEQKTEADLRFEFGTNQLQIVKNTFGVNNVQPTLLPTKNSNGMGIGSMSYDSGSKTVTVTLASGITTVGAFPFAIGDEVMVENVSVGIASTNPQGVVEIVNTGKGYNTENYNYKLFVLTSVDENIGGIGTVAFSLDGYIPTGEIPGTFNSVRSAGRIIPKKHFPVFEVDLTTTDFIEDENIICLDDTSMTGIVENWDSRNGNLKINTTFNFKKDHVIEGQTSGTRGSIASIISSDSEYDIDSQSRVESGWDDVIGFLNDTRQVVQDGDYYQKFSYSLKSKVPLDTWDEVVGAVNHTAGFKKFSDLVIETSPIQPAAVGLGTTTSYFENTIDYISDVDMNCVYNFDLVKENDKTNFSDKIIVSNRILTDYEESVGNRVLNVDNVASQFNSNPRPTKFSEVARWPIADACGHKFVTYIQDPDTTAESQIQMVSVLHDKQGSGFINQYAITSTEIELGSFDYTLDGTDGVLQFFPNKFKINPYNIFNLTYNIGAAVTNTDTKTLGGAVKITSSSQNVSAGATTNIVSIGNSYTAAKVLVLTKTIDNQFEYDELNLISDGTTVDVVEYGELSSVNLEAWSGGYSGLGTYNAYIDGGNIKVDFAPNVSVASSVNTIIIGISSAGTGIGSEGLVHAEVGALPTSIGSTSSPTANAIAEYNNSTFNGGYFIVQVSDPNNDHHMLTELLVVDKPDFNETFISEFGTIVSDEAPAAGLGTFGASVVGDVVRVTFTPNENINTEVKTYYNYMKHDDDGSTPTKIDLTSSYIDTQFGTYAGTDVDVKRAFNILYGGYQVFERYIDASDEDVVGSNTSLDVQNAITIPNHFFVTGEQLTYSTPGAGTTENIGIGATTISGVSTDKLPGTVFAIKVDANRIRLTDTAQKALAAVPNDYFDITSVGIGTSHTFTANNQNTKCLIAIDNYIQSPVVATALTTSLSDQLFSSQGSMFLSGIGSIAGGELLQIGEEIVKVQSVGVGSTNQVRVRRGWLGTRRAGYGTGALVTKVQGNYNITNNTLNFVEAPYGNIPIGSPDNPPDERDWTGITTSSTFQGRVFLRSGTPGSSVRTYGRNYLFDDIADQFDGSTDTFRLKSEGSDTTGYEDDNAILLINDIVQIPGLINNFTLAEQAGITSAVFINDGQTITHDVNSSNLPIGGVIISVGSSEGFGYQPLAPAGGTATVSTAGTISAITIGSTGSGYRASETYDVLTSVATTVAAGATIITINDQNSVFKYLEFNAGAASSIGVGSFFSRPAPIISVGTTSVNIGIGSTSSSEIPAGTDVLVRVFNPSVGIVRVGVASSAVGIQTVTHIGVATISAGHLLETVHVTSVGSGYTSSDLPEVIIDDPLSYANIPLIYQTDGLAEASTGVGSQAKVNINVGFGSDIIDFEVSNTGFGYGRNQNLTIPTGGPTGIPTNPTLGGDFERFTINVEKIYSDKFAGWSIGQLQTLDNFDAEFDSQKTDFQIKIDGTITSIIASKGSSIVIQDVLIVLYNNILQVPGEGYIFNGGSTIVFPEPPKPGDKVDILFYRGNGSVDVKSIDILETVKQGDTLDIEYDPARSQAKTLDEDARLVYSVDSTDQVTTNAYYGPGLAYDINLERPVKWCRQTEDKIINGERVGKDRPGYKANVFPTSNVIQTVGVGSTAIYVENVQPLFNQQHEASTSLAFQKDVLLVSQDTKVGASATATVGSAGTITAITISDGGTGYTSAPVVIIGNPVGLGSEQRQTATASITAGVVTSITLGAAKTGYSQSNPPVVLIESPSVLTERLSAGISYRGDFGTIVGVTTTTVGVATGLVFDLFIPNNSALKDTDLVGTAVTVSTLAAGDFFVVRNSNVGLGVTSLKPGGAVAVGVGTTCIDNVYEVVSSTNAQKTLPGVGSTTVNKVTVSVLSYNGYDFSAVGVNTHFGDYSFGRIETTGRTSTSTFNFYNQDGVSGITTSALVRRFIPLKIKNYNV